MTANATRLPAVRSLSAILPPGTEGGKEFARIVGLLLFQDSRRSGREFNLFDDASGDYEGLDSFSRQSKTDKATGYQYKFFSSPLSDGHRQQIKHSLSQAAEKSKNLELEKYVVVTPDDLKNSATRANGGDVEWFETLRRQYRKHFEIEHIGHSKLQNLFLQAHHLCLYYYPDLVPSGLTKRKTILEIRTLYDQALKTRFGRIEFVGMSVYKDEASRRIPLEDIYIPLSVVPERSPEESEDTPRVDPIVFLSAGSKTVILGDPGSGKSTLLGFLALAGISEALQNRCNIRPDNRLTIIVTLRRYADELKRRANLPLLDYIVEVTIADFNIDAFDKDFLEFYLESGQVILLFDGLDELPGSAFKAIIRKRVETFNSTYPANTLIVTSRIIGYEADIRFDESFSHYRVAKLKTGEIARFINDWYSARIEDSVERARNSSDLVRVITNPDNDAIRDLARNPLLLTIVALVHRIDAVLPDQRVILYQKCTETLLNTWYKAKKQDEEIAKGRIERRNRLRVEAIAYWLHRRSIEGGARAIAPHAEVLGFLTKYISGNEPTSPDGEPAEDQAEVFLDFIKSGAGLLIEAGDGLYSFIHLTFQEYLSATHLTSFAEIGGAQSIWDELGGDLANPRWREVVRLLVASLRSTKGQRFFIEKLLASGVHKETRDSALLLMGLLRDGIEPAEEEALAIIMHAFETLQTLQNVDDVRAILGALRAWLTKDVSNAEIGEQALRILSVTSSNSGQLVLALTRQSVNLQLPTAEEQTKLIAEAVSPLQGAALGRLIFASLADGPDVSAWQQMIALHDYWAAESPEGNVAAAVGLCLSMLLDPVAVPHRLLRRELIMLGTAGYGPHCDHMMNLIALAHPFVELPKEIVTAINGALGNNRGDGRVERAITSILRADGSDAIAVDREDLRKSLMHLNDSIRSSTRRKISRIPKTLHTLVTKTQRTVDSAGVRELTLIRGFFRERLENDPPDYWHMILESEVYVEYIFPSLETSLGLNPAAHWQEALRASLRSRVSSVISKYFCRNEWASLAVRLRETRISEDDLAFAAWLVLLDTWILEYSGYRDADASPLRDVVESAQGHAYPPLEFAICVRNICLELPGSAERMRDLISDHSSGVAAMLTEVGWPLLATAPQARRPSRKRRLRGA